MFRIVISPWWMNSFINMLLFTFVPWDSFWLKVYFAWLGIDILALFRLPCQILCQASHITVSLGFVSGALSCFFVWNIFAQFFIFLDSLY